MPGTSMPRPGGSPMIGRLTRRSALAAWILLAAIAVTLLPAPPAHAQQTALVVTGYGGRLSEGMKNELVEPLKKKHVAKVEIGNCSTNDSVAQLMDAWPRN